MDKVTNLNLIDNASILAEEAGVVQGAAISLDIDLNEGDEGCPFKVYIGTYGGLRKFVLSGTDVKKLTDWFASSLIDSYAAFNSPNNEIFEVIKHRAISGIRVEHDHEMAKELARYKNVQ